ncbi:MAG: 4Fe-4S dicluster domain-containing protein [Desulfobacterales bacterium]|nr:4Fe-4S dicluster domain-containing protein [Desulfobacterales bacterium]
MDRRTFLKIAGTGSLAFAAGCSRQPEKTLYAVVRSPEDQMAGSASWYASTCRECPAGCGILVKNREGRAVKIEGNPLHPVNQGALCMRGQAALQGVYNPDRIKLPLLKTDQGWRTLSFSAAEALLIDRLERAARKKTDSIRMLTELAGDALLDLFARSLERFGSRGPTVFEPFAYESLKTANRMVFGADLLPSFRLEKADFLLSCGADFLETWLSPVEYARKFKKMHALRHGRKNVFCWLSPYRSLTGANADLWLPCRPGSEATILFALINSALNQGRGEKLPENVRAVLGQAVLPFTPERALHDSGIARERYVFLERALFQSKSPLVLGAGTSGCGPNTWQTDLAAALLNRILDPEGNLLDFDRRHRLEKAARRSEVLSFFESLLTDPAEILLLYQTNPLFTLADPGRLKEALEKPSLFVVSFSNFMDETAQVADLVFPTRFSLESWDEYSGKQNMISMLQPAMGSLTRAPGGPDVFTRIAFGPKQDITDFRTFLISRFLEDGTIKNQQDWIRLCRQGGRFDLPAGHNPVALKAPETAIFSRAVDSLSGPLNGPVFVAAPSLRFFDGRGANRPWLCEIPDPLTRVAWQTPVLANPETLGPANIRHKDMIRLETDRGAVEALVYETPSVHPGVFVMSIGQGHRAYGRYADKIGENPVSLLSSEPDAVSGGPRFFAPLAAWRKINRQAEMAHTDGSRSQHNRPLALSVALSELTSAAVSKPHGPGTGNFPLALPLPEGYDKTRDIYPPHQHEDYRWAMAVDLDRCIGCGACTAACYAENNLGIVGVDQVVRGREMAWISVERYEEPDPGAEVAFLPMLCQHCDNAPCEPVCPVYAPHHSAEGLNNQIYNRCIGTRFCSQNCPYKVRRFNWFTWEYPNPLNLQLNPDVTVRSKGVMEKCSFCVQRIKDAHDTASHENRAIRDGEVRPACLQTCPTGVFTFGNLVDRQSRVRKLMSDPRAYQVLGHLNTKPAVIYLKKVRI